MENFSDKIQIFYDGVAIEQNYLNPIVKGYTTNPSLLNGVKYLNYKEFADNYLKYANNLPVSFEIFADDDETMIEQGKIINTWGSNVYVKIPIINSQGKSTEKVIQALNKLNIKLNITVIYTEEQLNIAFSSLINKNIPSIISIFAGRISDVGVNPKQICLKAVELCKNSEIKILWASTREVYNIFQAIEYNCDIITVPSDILNKLHNIGKDLNVCAIDTVSKFYEDGIKSNIKF
jgi:transaldolase